MEACWNWGWLYDLPGEIPQVETGRARPSLQEPTTRASGGRVFHGRLLWQCNSYFGGLYRAARGRGRNRNVALPVVAHRLAAILWHCLKENRPYAETIPENPFPDRSEPQMTEE